MVSIAASSQQEKNRCGRLPQPAQGLLQKTSTGTAHYGTVEITTIM
jgi:hypothetical protein